MYSVPLLGAPALRGPEISRPPAPVSFPYFPFFPGGWDYGYAPAQNITIVQSPPSYVVVPERPPQPPVRAEIREYKPPPPAESSAAAEAPSFAIALKDGSVHFASAVTVQQDTLLYVDPDGRHERVSLNAVDRETTKRLNRVRNLELRLPIPATR